MTNNKDLFMELSNISTLKVQVEHSKFIIVNGKGTVAILTNRGTKLISDVLYIPKIYQNLLSFGQLVEKSYEVLFENKICLIKDAKEKDILKVKMRGKSFALNPLEEEQIVFSIKENITELSHKRQKIEEKQANSKTTTLKRAIAQEHTNKKIHLREKDERIEQNEKCIKPLNMNFKVENAQARSHVKEAIVFQHCKSIGRIYEEDRSLRPPRQGGVLLIERALNVVKTILIFNLNMLFKYI